MRAVPSGRGERGAVVVLVAIAIAVLLGFLAFVLNAGHATGARGELQNGSDAAALAGARELNGRESGVASARQVAIAFAFHHDTDTTRPIFIHSGDVRFCNWDPIARDLRWCLDWGATPTSAPPPAPTPGAPSELLGANVLRVRDGREFFRGNPLPVWFSAFVGWRATIDARSRATAVGGGPSVLSRVLPIAYSDSALVGSNGVNCSAPIVFRDNNDDTAAFTSLDDSAGGVGNPEILAILEALTGLRSGPTVRAGDSIDLKNGNVLGSQIWGILTTMVGQEYSVPVVHAEGGRLNQQQPVVGFATILIQGVYPDSGASPPAACADGVGTIVTPCIVGTITCGGEIRAPPGGGFFGLSTRSSRLVQ